MREARFALLKGLRQAGPELQPVRASPLAQELLRRALGVRDTAARGHPVDRAGLDRLHRADAVTVDHSAFEKVGYGRESDVRMRTHVVLARLLALLGPEMIEEEKRAYGLLLRRGQQTTHLRIADFAQARAKDEDLSHWTGSLTRF